ncbi:hypothetical protein EDD11_004809 [Mortierella claussenii]|nr:hypothetical protein EDD11_004809 [Mortierella claussenii]
MIDLTGPWTTSRPAYKKLRDAPLNSTHTSMTLSSNLTQWWAILDNKSYHYNISQDTWTAFTVTAGPSIDIMFGEATVDPNEDIIYILNGLGNATNPLMARLNLDSHIVDSTPMFSGSQLQQTYGSIWSTVRKSMLVFDTVGGGVYSYSLGSGWSRLQTKGTAPTSRSSTHIASAYGGKTIVLYSGVDVNSSTTVNDIYFLDVATLTWTKGPDMDPVHGRASAVCAVSGDYFIVWGGAGNDSSGSVIIYDMSAATWTDHYSPPLAQKTSDFGTPALSDAPEGNSRVGTIAGASGGIVVVLAAVGFIWCRWRAKRSQIVDDAIVLLNKRAPRAPAALLDDGKCVVPTGRLQEDTRSSRSLSQRPYPSKEEFKRLTVQEGEFGTPVSGHHPHTHTRGTAEQDVLSAKIIRTSPPFRRRQQHPHVGVAGTSMKSIVTTTERRATPPGYPTLDDALSRDTFVETYYNQGPTTISLPLGEVVSTAWRPSTIQIPTTLQQK